MKTRREFLAHTTAAGLLTASSLSLANGSSKLAMARRPRGVRIKSVIRREETLLRHGGEGDNWHMTWAADDRQYMGLCDGYGWDENPKHLYNSRLFTISGGPEKPAFEEVAGYPLRTLWATESRPLYYGWGTLALDSCIYQFLGTNGSPEEGSTPNAGWHGAKLIYSPDNGRTWCNQNGSTPVVFETWGQRSRDNMAFFNEPQDAFSLITLLQMGQNYSLNRDGYVYGYAPSGATRTNELVMFRVPKTRILHRSAYEFFAGLEADGGARWTKDIQGHEVVHTFPRGWIASPHSWCPSIVYNAPLQLYLMANWVFGGEKRGAFATKPSYLGFWSAPNPWGPWMQIHEETAWFPGGDLQARAYEPQISPKWIAPDGKSLWLVWTDFQHTSEYTRLGTEEGAKVKSDEEFARLATRWKPYRPYYAFNTQRVDLIVT